MSIRDELIQRAIVSTEVACGRASRVAVVALMDTFNVSHVGEFNCRTLDAVASYIEAVEALPAAPPKVPVEFLIGERVALVGQKDRYNLNGTVIGYQVRYLVKLDNSSAPPVFGHMADRLKSLEIEATPSAPVHFDFAKSI